MSSKDAFKGPSVAKRLQILQVNSSDAQGGAHRVAFELQRAYRDQGHVSWLAVGRKRTGGAGVFEVPNETSRTRWAQVLRRLSRHAATSERGVVSHVLPRVLNTIAEPVRWFDWRRGREECFAFPGTWSLLELLPDHADLVHCHNLHGGYFDLRVLPELSRRVPVVLTLHDAWLLSGHCAHSFDCARWETGCGSCPDLSIYPPVKRDATAANWRRKAQVFAATDTYLSTPCEWLMRRVERSLLASSVVEARVIPYGVDRAVFRPGDQARARALLGLPPTAAVLLFTATGARTSQWRDFGSLRLAAAEVAEAIPAQDVIVVALGEAAPDERIGRAIVRSMPYRSGTDVALFYQAADLYLHPARADTFPNAVLEALACGIPVVATAVGGIPEQVRPDTGTLVRPGDHRGMAQAAAAWLNDADQRTRAGVRAAEDVATRFDLHKQAKVYLDWYEEILDRRSVLGDQSLAR